MLTREALAAKIEEYRQAMQEYQANVHANQGAMMACEDLLALFDQEEQEETEPQVADDDS